MDTRALPAVEALEARRLFSAASFGFDPSFGGPAATGGALPLDLSPGFSTYTTLVSGNAMAVQPDGKIVVAGSLPLPVLAGAKENTEIVVERFNADGTSDRSFGAGAGRVTADLTPQRDHAIAVAVQADGAVVVAGVTGYAPQVPSGHFDTVLLRFTPAGAPDPSFGTDGRLTLDLVPQEEVPYQMQVQPDGKLLIAGVAATEFDAMPAGYRSLLLERLRADGAPDPSFGTNGAVTNPITSVWEDPKGVALQPDGKIVVAVARSFRYDRPRSVLLRFNPDGTRDNTFVAHETLAADPDYLNPTALASLPDGSLVEAGADAAGPALRRFDRDGNPVASFGTAGRLATSNTASIVVTPDNTVVTGGWVGGDQSSGPPSPTDTVVAGYRPDGTPDERFGTAGVITDSFATGSDAAQQLALAPDGSIIVRGAAGTQFLARLAPGARLPPPRPQRPPRFARLMKDGTLRVTGTRRADLIVVSRFDSADPFDAGTFLRVSLNGLEGTFPLASVKSLFINAKAGDDNIPVAADVPVPVTIVGGAGNDAMSGGAAADTLLGGPGDDLLNARDTSRDILNGGPGNDRALKDEFDVLASVETLLA